MITIMSNGPHYAWEGGGLPSAIIYRLQFSFISLPNPDSQNTKSALPLSTKRQQPQRHDDTPLTESWLSLETPSTWTHLMQSGSYLSSNPDPQWPQDCKLHKLGFSSLGIKCSPIKCGCYDFNNCTFITSLARPLPWHLLPQHQMLVRGGLQW